MSKSAKTVGNVTILLGVLMLIVGIAGGSYLPVTPFAYVVVDGPPTIYNTYPYLSSSSQYPTDIGSPGKQIELSMSAFDDVTPTSSLRAWVTVTDPSGTLSEVTLPWKYDNPATRSGVYAASWTIPQATGTYKFDFTIVDAVGGTTRVAGYGRPNVAMDGYFTINGVKITDPQQIVRLPGFNLKVDFIPTSGGDLITAGMVKVTVSKETSGVYNVISALDMQKASNNQWSGTYTLPGYGKYKVDGYLSNNLKLSLFADTGILGLPNFTTTQLLFLFLGFMLIGTGFAIRRK